MNDEAPRESAKAPRWWTLARDALVRARGQIVPQAPEYDVSGGRKLYLLGAYVSRRFFVEDRCAGMAAVLTLHTLLSAVPIIGTALLVVGLMDESSGRRLLSDLFQSLVPEGARANDMAEGVLALAENVTIGNLGAWGFLVTLSIAFVLFQTLERTFNSIWRVNRRRSVLVKFTMFYTLATLGPLLMLYSLAHPFVPGIKFALGIPWLTSTLGLIALNRFLPNTAVDWRGALLGGIVSAALIEFAKLGFGFYATRFALATYEGLYGPLAILPILLVWSYLSWMVVLLGAQIAYVTQHRGPIALMGYLNRYVLDKLAIQQPSGRTAARLMLAVADHYARREAGMGEDDLAERFGLSLDVVQESLARLEREGLVLDAEGAGRRWVPGRPLDQIRVLEVVELFDRDHARNPRRDRLGDVWRRIDDAREALVGDLTYAQLADSPRSSDEPDTTNC
ncbi:MAG: YhjD/YihY/BrkB family envelope integrity protein [Nannocystaceae bacterium]|nr:YihY family inner membrane protein [bacterium]